MIKRNIFSKSCFLLFFTYLFSAFLCPLFAQDSLNVSLISQLYHPWDRARDVKVNGDFAFVATDNTGLRIVDISDTGNPEEVGYINNRNTNARKVAVTDSFAYVLYRLRDDFPDSGLSIVDITNVENPEEVGYYSFGRQAVNDVDVLGDFVYISCTFADLVIIDVSDPENPTNVIYFDSEEYWTGASTIVDTIAFLAASETLQLLDITDPTDPVEIGSLDTPGTAKNIAVGGDYVYLACDEAGLRIVDISDLAHPIEVSDFNPDVLVKRVTIFDEYAFVSTSTGHNNRYSGGLYVLDISDPTDPTEITIIETRYGLGGNAVSVSEDIAYVADYDSGLREIDISDITNPVEVGYFDGPHKSNCVTISGGFAYVADTWSTFIGFSDLWIIDISDSSNPEVTGYCHLPGGGAFNTIIVSNDYAYVTVQDSGFIIIDVHDPVQPVEVGRLSSIGRVDVFALQGDIAFLADRNYGLSAVDISDPSTPRLISTIQFVDEAMSISLSETYAYIASYGENAGLYVVDIENPDNPELISFLQLSDEFHFWGLEDVSVSGDNAYVTGSYEHEYLQTLSKIDISDPENPELIWTTTTYPYGYDVVVYNDYAFIPAAMNGFHIYDLNVPEEVGYYQNDFYSYHDIAISDNLAFTVDWKRGLQIYDISLAMNQVPPDEKHSIVTNFSVLPPYPNPFNSQLIIPLEIHKNGVATFSVSNILGQRLANITRTYKAGSHNFVFNADQQGLRLSNGAYFFKIQYNGNEEIKNAFYVK